MTESVHPTGAIILLIEEHEDTRAVLTAALTGAGFQVHPVATYAEARGILETLRVAVVVFDLDRDESSLDDAVEMRSRPHPPGLIALTERALEQGRRRAVFDVYLMKPCPPEHLVLAVEGVLARRT